MSNNFPAAPWFLRDGGHTPDGNPYFWIGLAEDSAGGGVRGEEYLNVSGIMSRETASLISAAPDLLAALESIIEINPALPMGIIEAAELAVKKARGAA